MRAFKPIGTNQRNNYQQRGFDPKELFRQIRPVTFLAICGGRWNYTKNEEGEIVEVGLPCGKGYSVAITLAWNDTYIVRRDFGVKNPRTKGVLTDVYCDQVSEVAYQASLFANSKFGQPDLFMEQVEREKQADLKHQMEVSTR